MGYPIFMLRLFSIFLFYHWCRTAVYCQSAPLHFTPIPLSSLTVFATNQKVNEITQLVQTLILSKTGSLQH
jgi:hypothetical protein